MVKKTIVQKALKTISEREGVLKPKVVVDEARPESSPLHSLFDWDDTSAGEKYRLWQARQLIASVRVEYADKEVDAYYNVQIESVPQKGYYSVEQVVSSEDLYNAVLKTALDELSHWKEKYKEIKELREVINQDKYEQVVASV